MGGGGGGTPSGLGSKNRYTLGNKVYKKVEKIAKKEQKTRKTAKNSKKPPIFTYFFPPNPGSVRRTGRG